MAVITIRKYRLKDEIVFEVDDFNAYAEALIETGIEAPKAKYRVSIPSSLAEEMLSSKIDVDREVALFFRLSPASGLGYHVVDHE